MSQESEEMFRIARQLIKTSEKLREEAEAIMQQAKAESKVEKSRHN
jgi:hypothetical protein